MGIKDLCQFLKKLQPELIVSVPLEQLSGHALAVDASVYLYKFICVNNQFKGNWIDMFITLVQWLRRFNIRPVFVFDGKPPQEKSATQTERRERRQKIQDQSALLESVLEQLGDYELNAEIPAELTTTIETVLQESIEMMPRKQVLVELNNRYKKILGQNVRITREDIDKIKNILKFAGLPVLQATGEAERSCAWLCRWGFVSGVITSDSDVLAYGSTVFIQDIRANQPECKMIRHCDVLETTGFTEEQFKDFCIMCGTDYNERIPNIGPAKAYQLLHAQQTIENIGMEMDVSPLAHTTCRNLFTVPDKSAAKELFEGEFSTHYSKPNQGQLTWLLNQVNSRFSAKELIENPYKATFLIKGQ